MKKIPQRNKVKKDEFVLGSWVSQVSAPLGRCVAFGRHMAEQSCPTGRACRRGIASQGMPSGDLFPPTKLRPHFMQPPHKAVMVRTHQGITDRWVPSSGHRAIPPTLTKLA